jgi:hypothetical protein
MSHRGFLGRSIAALASVSMLVVSLNPASAFPLGAPSLQQHFVSAEVQNVWWCRWNCGPRVGGWGPAALVGGLVAGAVVGAAIAAPHGTPAGSDGSGRMATWNGDARADR